jgi:hypothetical protein
MSNDIYTRMYVCVATKEDVTIPQSADYRHEIWLKDKRTELPNALLSNYRMHGIHPCHIILSSLLHRRMLHLHS